MKVAITVDVPPRGLQHIARFLGRNGDYATREELVAFIASTLSRRLDELAQPMEPVAITVTAKGRA